MQLSVVIDTPEGFGWWLRCGWRIAFATLVVTLGCLLCTMSAVALDATRAARMRLTVEGDEGQPLPGARIWIAARTPGWLRKPEDALELKTNAAGGVVVERQRPDSATKITWSEAVQVELDGYLPTRVWYTLFPGSRTERTIRMEAERTTRIRLHGPHGEPLPRVQFSISYVKNGTRYTDHGDPAFFVTDERGECLWRHGKLEDGFQLSGRPDDEWWNDAPVVTIAYQESELPVPSRRLQGKLLRTDGSVAAGWLVAHKVRFIGGYGVVSGPTWNQVQIEGLQRIGSDGRFEVSAGQMLVAFSPVGTPIVYSLDPSTWPPGTRQVTLRTPDVRQVHRGVVVNKEDQPVAGLRIDATRTGWDGQLWEFIAAKDTVGYSSPLWHAEATDGTPVNGIVTDNHGRYAVTTYYGATPQCRVYGEQGSLEDWDGLGSNEKNIWRPRDSVDPERFKDVLLVFQDEQGRPVPSVHAYQIDQYAVGRRVHTKHYSGSDARGQHVFVDHSVDQLRLESRDSERKWLAANTAVDVAATDDQVIAVTMRERHRLPSLAGRVLGPEGIPVANAHVYLYKRESGKRDRYGNDYLRFHTEADKQGRFSFEAAPNDCYIEIRSSRRQKVGDSLPGWTPPLAVDQRTRDVVIRLRHGGSVKVRLPPGMRAGARGLFLKREDVPDDTPTRLRNVYFAFDPERDELLSDIQQPGWYRLSNYLPEWAEAMAAIGTVRVEVKPGEQAELDLRRLEFAQPVLPEPRPRSWVTVTVKAGKQAVSGAEVAVYGAVARPEDLARWLEQCKTGDAMRDAAMRMLKKAGAVAIDAIRTADPGDDQSALLKELQDVENDGLHRIAFDLSDDRGTVRCEVDSGRNCVAVARVRGRMIGWQAFAADGQKLTVHLRPARTLVVGLKQTTTEADYPIYGLAHIRLKGPSAPGIRGLMSALTYCRTSQEHGGWVYRKAIFDHQYRMRSGGDQQWSIEDLPVGAVCTVTLFPLPTDDEQYPPVISRRITIEPGVGVQKVEW